jgi:predicted phage terminase large subunit-like protein
VTWKILYLPAEDPDTGEALWPEYFSSDRLKAIKTQMGSPLYKCMYLGDPAGLSGEIFNTGWFRLATLKIAQRGPNTDKLDPEEMIQWLIFDGQEEKPLALENFLLYQFWDLAISEKQTADYTVGVTLALYPQDMSMVILDVVRGHWSFSATQVQMALAAERWRPLAIGIESVAYQAAAVQEARNHLLFPIVDVKTDRDKVTRARLPAALAEGGKMSIVRGLWTDDFFDEIAQFPNGQKDDQVDGLSGVTALAQTYVPSSFFLFS